MKTAARYLLLAVAVAASFWLAWVGAATFVMWLWGVMGD